jgi:hypothetical protein
MPTKLIQAVTITFVLYLLMGLSTPHTAQTAPITIGQTLELQKNSIP